MRSIAAVVLLVLVAAAGAVVVHELTRPQPSQPIGPIIIDPGVQTGEAGKDDDGLRPHRRREGDRKGGFSPPSTPANEPGAGGDPATTPQIEVPTPPAGESEDDGGED